MPSNILVAFDKFKDALTAFEACSVAADTCGKSFPESQVSTAPLTDGGEGFLDVMVNQLGGERTSHEVLGPRYEKNFCDLGWVDIKTLSPTQRKTLKIDDLEGKLAIIEMAAASGLESLSPDDRDPWGTTTFGTGQLILQAHHDGAKAILLGIGGSATNDCGLGALEALGVIAYDRELQPVKGLHPANWKFINSLGGPLQQFHPLPPVRIASDVRNPLLGERGATKVFGPQKGLKEEDKERMERQMRKTADRLLGLFGKVPASFPEWHAMPFGGAAGGIGFGLKCAIPDLEFISGADWVSEVLQLPQRIEQADWILSGEGRLDTSSLEGKGPIHLLEQAGPAKRVSLLVGSVETSVQKALEAQYPNLDITCIADSDKTLETNLREAAQSLQTAVQKLSFLANAD